MDSVHGSSNHLNNDPNNDENDYWKKIETQPFKAELLAPPDAMLGGDIDINQMDFMSYINNGCSSSSRLDSPFTTTNSPNSSPFSHNFNYLIGGGGGGGIEDEMEQVAALGTIAPKSLLVPDPTINDDNSFAIEFAPFNKNNFGSFNPNLFTGNRTTMNNGNFPIPKTQIHPLGRMTTDGHYQLNNASMGAEIITSKSINSLSSLSSPGNSSHSLDGDGMGMSGAKRSLGLQSSELNKRDAHMASEQRRRAQMKDAYDTLAQLLPPEEYRKQTKANLLNASINYIRKLIKSYKLLEHHHVKMQEEIKNLQLQLQKHQQQLKEKKEKEKTLSS